jgi:hypothetical protein
MWRRVDGLTAYGRRNRQLIRRQYALIAAVLLLTVAVWVLAHRADHAAEQARRATTQARIVAATQKETCEAGNETRRAARAAWNDFYDAAVAGSSDKARATAVVAPLRKRINDAYADRDCDITK